MRKKAMVIYACGAAALTLFVAGVALIFLDEWLVKRDIKLVASDPDSVVLRSLRRSSRDDSVWCGEFNARNQMGGMAGFKKFVFKAPWLYEWRMPAEIKRLFVENDLRTEDHYLFDSEYALHCRQ